MKLVRYGPCGQEKPGMIDDSGHVRDISRIVNDISPEQLGDRALSLIRAADVNNFPLVPAPCRLGPPVSRVGKFLAIGS